MTSTMRCTVCDHDKFEKIYEFKKLRIFSALRPQPFSETSRFDAAVWRCKKCGFVQQKLTPALEKFLADFYTKEESFFSAPPAEDDEAPVVRVASNIEFLKHTVRHPVANILEIGSYDGYFLDAVRRAYKLKSAVGIEILNKKNKFPHVRMIHDVYPTDAVAGEKFDLIILMNVLEHVFDPRVFISALRENLTERGSVLIEVPNEEWAFKTGMISFQHQHISYFTPKTLKIFLNRSGFKIDSIYTKDHDRMLLVCSKAVPRFTRFTADSTSKLYKKRVHALIARFNKIAATKKKPIGLYGSSTFTHNMVQIAGVGKKIYLFDGDERKVGKFMSDIPQPVRSWRDIDDSGVDKIIIMPLGFTRDIATFLHGKKLKTRIGRLFSYQTAI